MAAAAAEDKPAGGYGAISPGHEVQISDPKNRGLALRRPISTATRIIINFWPQRCLSAGKGFSDDLVSGVPAAIAARGVSADDWKHYTGLLQSDVQSRQWGILWTVLAAMTGVGVPFVCIAQRRYHIALRRWIDHLNHEVLEPKGLFAKFQTNAVHSKNYNEEISWLAVALTEEEAESLRHEPTFWRPECCGPGILPDRCGESCACCCCARRVV